MTKPIHPQAFLSAETKIDLDADDITFTNVAGTDMVAGVLIYSGEDPIAHIEPAIGLPMGTNGGDIIVTWDNGRNHIFRT